MYCTLYFFKVQHHDKEEYCVERIYTCKTETFYKKIRLLDIRKSFRASAIEIFIGRDFEISIL